MIDRRGTRRSLLWTGAALGAAASLPSLAWAADPPEAFVEVETAQGRLRGARIQGVSAFKGVPYAGSVSGRNRFRTAPPPAAWTGVRDALRLGPPSIQEPGQVYGIDEPAPAEDCLVLNLWTPATDGGRRPVMVYSHGGGFTTGSGGSVSQDGARLAREYGVVLIETNHRLGVMGYLYLGELLGPEYQGNQGLADLVSALEWVRTNVSAFGGDPHNVTIFGESGGATKTACLYEMDQARHLFHKAAIESNAGPDPNPPAHATEIARQVMARVGLAPHEARRLLEVPAAALLKAQLGDADTRLGPGTLPPPGEKRSGPPPLPFGPVIGAAGLEAIPFTRGAPEISRDKPLIVGGCKEETIFFNRLDPTVFSLDAAGLKARLEPKLGADTGRWIELFQRTRPGASPTDLYIAISTAMPWRASAIRIGEAKARQAEEQGGAPVFMYIFSYESEVTIAGTHHRVGAPHAGDIAVTFDNVPPAGSPPPADPGFFDDPSEGKRRTARNMSALWTSFARTGQPSAPGQPAWPAYTLDRRATMLIDAECRVVDDPEGEERRFWQSQGVWARL